MIDYSNKSFLAEKESQVFNYTGDVLKIHLLAGVYKFECAGGRGGNAYNNTYSVTGAYGSYISSDVYLSKNLDLYCYIGQKGIDGNSGTPGWNGGGWGGLDNYGGTENGAGGGGATDVRLILEDLKSRIIVAGGGGEQVDGEIVTEIPPLFLMEY